MNNIKNVAKHKTHLTRKKIKYFLFHNYLLTTILLYKCAITIS